MHELPIIKSVYKQVIRHAEAADAASVSRVVLEIGVLRDFIPEFVQKYWDYVAKDSIAQGAVVEIREVEAEVECGNCGKKYSIGRENFTSAKCPECGFDRGTLVAGSELRIVGIEITKNNGTVQKPPQAD